MSEPTATLLRLAEYLALAEAAEEKSEYEDGVIIPMVGATESHILIMMHVQFLLYAGLREKDFRVYNSEMRICTPDRSRYYYPDASVVAGAPQFDTAAPSATLLNPCLIVEVLAKSSAPRDRGKKFVGYRLLPTFREYLLIAQEQVQVTQWVQQPDQTWQQRDYTSLADLLDLVHVPIQLPLREIYRNIMFEQE